MTTVTIVTMINHTTNQILRIKYKEFFELFAYIREEMPSWNLTTDDVIIRTDTGNWLTYLVHEKNYDVRNVSDI